MKNGTLADEYVPKVCILGAGFSGILAGIKLKTELGFKNYTIFDENSDVGGTWLVNTYPGCACDVQSHLYSYSFELNPYWSHNYSPQPEIWEYLRNVARKYDLYRHIKFNSQIKRMIWDEDVKKWRVIVYNKVTKTTDELLFDLLINSPGGLRVPNIPEEFKNFKGQMIHTATWDSSVELENKIVAVIGSGSSGVQIIPELAEKVKELHCYQRKPAWVMPRRQFKFPNYIQWAFANIPFLMVLYRWLIFLIHELFFMNFIQGSKISKLTTWLGKKHLKDQLPDEETLRERLLPEYRPGCKRIVASNEYFPAMKRPNVYLHREPIIKVKDHSILTAKEDLKIDILVLATGYRIQEYFAPLEIIAKNSQDVMELWQKDRPRSYLGIVSAISPNSFMLLGPNTGLGHNTVVFMIECQMNYITQLLKEFFRRKARVIVVKDSTEEEFHRDLDQAMEKTLWGNEKCGSWYANMRGIITTLWPYSCINYWRKTRVPDFSKFDFY